MYKIFFTLIVSSSILFSAVDINTATFDELVSLKGIGKKKAKRILKYRKKHKCFKDFKEFKKVKGINKKTIKKNKKDLILSECKK
ncbi:MAG: helix-hairpin-helix domain-containing protein [Epsilonproteobacteria bacterium]|nr:helix-hairpin-helix domain-containing protein [Campylobacterota bacterium]